MDDFNAHKREIAEALWISVRLQIGVPTVEELLKVLEQAF